MWELRQGAVGLGSAQPIKTLEQDKADQTGHALVHLSTKGSARNERARPGAVPLPVQKLSGAVRGALPEVARSVRLHLPQAHVEGQRTDTDI